MPFSVVDSIALLVFIGCWFGYTWFARKKAKTSDCIAHGLHQHRIHWMVQVMSRENRVGDAALLANLERNIAFFASSTLLILAGVLTLFAQAEKLNDVLASVPFAQVDSLLSIQLKVSLIVFIFVFAFFKFTWSMRQYGFVNVMLGAAPFDESGKNENLRHYAKQMATVQDQAAHAYNNGLRGYYFSLAAMCWFFHPLLLILASLLVVYTLYVREFRSKAVNAIIAGQQYLKLERDAGLRQGS